MSFNEVFNRLLYTEECCNINNHKVIKIVGIKVIVTVEIDSQPRPGFWEQILPGIYDLERWLDFATGPKCVKIYEKNSLFASSQ